MRRQMYLKLLLHTLLMMSALMVAAFEVNQMKLNNMLLGLSLLTAAMAGCGGGGAAGGGGGATPGQGSLAVFLTDDPNPNLDQVWMTIHKVELFDDKGLSSTAFDDSTGISLDLARLWDQNGQRFQFLGQREMDAKRFVRARVVVAATGTVVPAGSQTAQSVSLDDSLARDGQGRVFVDFLLPNGADLSGGRDDLVIDFDLSQFRLENGKLFPHLRQGGRNGLDDSTRHEFEDYHGVVAGLSGTAPNLSFDLQQPGGNVLRVVADSNTTLFNSNGSANPILANGKRVEVRGRFDTGSRTMKAQSIKIEDESGQDSPEAHGFVSNIDPVGGTFDLKVTRAQFFLPTGTIIHVVTNNSTIYRSHGGLTITRAEFFAGIANTGFAEAEGSFNANTQTMTAHKAKVEDNDDTGGGGGGVEAEAKGRATAIDKSAGTFSLSPVSEYQGFVYDGQPLAVSTSGSTSYEGYNGESLTRAEFFALVGAAPRVQVHGMFRNGAIDATRARLQD